MGWTEYWLDYFNEPRRATASTAVRRVFVKELCQFAVDIAKGVETQFVQTIEELPAEIKELLYHGQPSFVVSCAFTSAYPHGIDPVKELDDDSSFLQQYLKHVKYSTAVNCDPLELLRQRASASVEEPDIQANSTPWKSLPRSELMERLAKGEIIGRDDEWIPGINGSKRALTSVQLRHHLQFADHIKEAAKVAFDQKNYEDALTKYTQGVRLLEWVTCNDSDGACDIRDRLIVFLRNQSLLAYKTDRWNECIVAASAALEINGDDVKALYWRARARVVLGDSLGARADLMHIQNSTSAGASAKIAATGALHDLRVADMKCKNRIRSLIGNTIDTERVMFTQPSPVIRNNSNNDGAVSPSGSDMTKSQTTTQPRSIELPLDVVKHALESVLQLYSSEDVRTELHQLRKLADYEEKRILLRFRKLQPDLLTPIFDTLPLNKLTYEQKKRVFDLCVGYWSKHDEEVRDLAKQIYCEIVGECND